MAASTLISLDGLFAVCRLAGDDPLPVWAAASPAGSLVSITRTADELSVVCLEELVPDDIRCERGWRVFRVAGTLDFTLVGVLAALLVPLADAGVAVFVLSTFDTDYLLVKEDRLDAAVEVLRREGHGVEVA